MRQLLPLGEAEPNELPLAADGSAPAVTATGQPVGYLVDNEGPQLRGAFSSLGLFRKWPRRPRRIVASLSLTNQTPDGKHQIEKIELFLKPRKTPNTRNQEEPLHELADARRRPRGGFRFFVFLGLPWFAFPGQTML